MISISLRASKSLISTVLLALAYCQAFAAPLVLKDDYRSPHNKERRLRKALDINTWASHLSEYERKSFREARNIAERVRFLDDALRLAGVRYATPLLGGQVELVEEGPWT